MNRTSPTGRRVLYISYDGMTDQLGQSQVLPYLTGLAARGHRITLLSFEKPARLAAGAASVRAICAAAGIAWRPLRYHRRPPVLSALWDLKAMERAAARLHRATPFDLVHARSYLPAAAGLRLKRRHGVRLLFDMRGFWPDERVEGGSWPQSSPLFRAVYARVKRLERRLLAGSDHVVSLTAAGRRVLAGRGELDPATPVTIIPCCADFDHFALPSAGARAAARAALGIGADEDVLAYLGSFGSWYMDREMLDLFAAWLRRRPRARLLVITLDPPAPILAAAAAAGIDPARLVVRPASRREVPGLLAAADLGLFFIRPVPSKAASSPTKMGEMMAMGLPILANAGVGDVAAILADTGCGVAIDRFDAAAYDAAIDRIEALARTPAEIRAAGRRWFDVADGIDRYDAIYRSL